MEMGGIGVRKSKRKAYPRSTGRLGAGGGGGGSGQVAPAGTCVPSGQFCIGGGGGGGGGGQGWLAGICDPSAQVCIAGGGGVVAHAASTTVAAIESTSRFISVSLF